MVDISLNLGVSLAIYGLTHYDSDFAQFHVESGPMVDYLFLSKEVMRIQAQTDQRNLASQKVLEKAEFKKEGTLRKNFFLHGEWTDDYIYSILRDE